MGKGGGGGPQTSEATQYTSRIPEFAEPYFREMMGRAAYETTRPYEPYPGQRLADFTAAERAGQAGIAERALSGGPAEMGSASDIASQVGYAPQGSGTDVAKWYNPQQLDPGDMGADRALDRYMDPFQRMVTDVEKREAQRQSDIQATGTAQQAAQAGGLGGYREAIMQAERERNLGQQMGDIEARGGQRAFEQAQRAYEADRAARMKAGQFDREQQYRRAGLWMTGLGEDRAGRQQQLGAAELLSKLGGQRQQMGYEDMRYLQAMGQGQRELAQQGLTMGYEDYMRQRGYPREQLSYLSNLIQGLPLADQTSYAKTTGTPGASPWGQAIGNIGGGVNLYKGWQSRGGGRVPGIAGVGLYRALRESR